ncbi:HEAT repeat domain-containing protein [Roseivirga sp.]|uniref:HEAT repeat domain-containing protein n=1 Tax=Roseivirga sp. TaxID=1964215 RepID=UPI003B520DDF
MNNSNYIDQLIEKYYNGETSLEEEKQLQGFFKGEDIPDHLKSHKDQFLMLNLLSSQSGTISDDQLFAKLDAGISDSKVIPINRSANFFTWTYRVAAAAVLVLVGFWIGGQFSTDSDVDAIRQELADLKSQLQSNSASGRLQAVSNVSGSDQSSEELVLTLEAVMKNDPNMHVRTKAVEALAKMGKSRGVVSALSGALLEETEPAVQIAIIEALVGLEEREAIGSLEKLTENEEVLKEVKDEAYIGIFKLKEM